ncbi:AraC family transcriptional regulator [Vibrio sp. SM6]|uniref:AraC family transcriptional regulator n=1 Tax=Vibrio agarilyticus TaxID=2726741 RepID=A0A7X8TN01_9VIBR|nr:helix-turn-helix domain-containing protein [Vibrio agarilyticus]NLS11534.1 AraC family transcriptional regulator [Vibrio agarilyticus]
MEKQTAQHISRINDVLFHIHQDITRDLPAKRLADIAAYSEAHFHRVFKQVVGESVHQYIRRTRMEYAANKLMFEARASVAEVSGLCGFNSISSFSRAFKATFGISPGEWRDPERHRAEKSYLKDPEIAAGYARVSGRVLPEPVIVDVPEKMAAYVRHRGYNRSIRKAWLILQAWANVERRDFSTQYGLHHSNPAWVDVDKCRYVACIAIDKPIQRRSVVNQMVIPGGLHAVFRLKGIYGELLPQISLVLEHWLPSSGFKQRSTPAFVHYFHNQFLEQDEHFELDFYLPVSFD